jgi:hypothetical protein
MNTNWQSSESRRTGFQPVRRLTEEPAIPGENPFCTRRIRPGALPYLFSDGMSWEVLLERLKNAAGWGEILGPHGSGKSTLLAGLVPRLEAQGWRIERFDLHDGQRRLPVNLRQLFNVASGAENATLLIVDGYEQLGGWNKFWLKRHCRRYGWGLIVTAHRMTGLPLLFDTAATLETARRVVAALCENGAQAVSAEEIAKCYIQCKGNLREMLFSLYDLYERQRV